MKNNSYIYGVRGEQYGIWNKMRKCWQFDICEDTPMLAQARLLQKIGYDGYKYRFEVRPLPKEKQNMVHEPALLTELSRKDRELKQTKKALRETQELLKKFQNKEAVSE